MLVKCPTFNRFVAICFLFIYFFFVFFLFDFSHLKWWLLLFYYQNAVACQCIIICLQNKLIYTYSTNKVFTTFVKIIQMNKICIKKQTNSSIFHLFHFFQRFHLFHSIMIMLTIRAKRWKFIDKLRKTIKN